MKQKEDVDIDELEGSIWFQIQASISIVMGCPSNWSHANAVVFSQLSTESSRELMFIILSSWRESITWKIEGHAVAGKIAPHVSQIQKDPMASCLWGKRATLPALS